MWGVAERAVLGLTRFMEYTSDAVHRFLLLLSPLCQTAYANGASTAYIRTILGLPVVLTKTCVWSESRCAALSVLRFCSAASSPHSAASDVLRGVKYLHHAAQGFDIGIYFEANGHGTVLFHHAFLARLRALACAPGSPAESARRRLLASSVLINQAVGDALSDLLFAEAVLSLKGWSVQDWNALYSDLPSRQCKLAVRDRSVVTTTDDETSVIAPRELQADIDSLVAATPKGRAFVRPSGTEDVVRVYAEADTQASADALASAVAKSAYTLAGGVGAPPS
jgi:phosphoacetylglucosamine mutase